MYIHFKMSQAHKRAAFFVEQDYYISAASTKNIILSAGTLLVIVERGVFFY